MSIYYNENDAHAARWLSNLSEAGLISRGDVDERPIEKVRPDDVMGYRRSHFFAGIGGWDLALSLAGWGDEVVWTGSCPCQPFSLAGKRKGKADPRHLWPEFRRLIAECRPKVIFGEQVASKPGRQWFGGSPGLQRVLDAQAIVGVLQAQGIFDGIPKSMQDMLSGKGENSQSENCSRSEVGDIQAIQEDKAGADPGELGQASREIEGDGVFAGGPRSSYSACDRCGRLRTHWNPIQSGRWENMGQPVSRSDRLDQGVFPIQCSCGALLRERDGEPLGREQDHRDRQCDHGYSEVAISRSSVAARIRIEAAHRHPELAGVRADLEALGYRVGAADLCSASIGAPHIRQRIFWVADADGRRRAFGPEPIVQSQRSEQQASRRVDAGGCSRSRRMGVTAGSRLEERQLGPGHHGSQFSPAQRAGCDANFWSDFDTIDCLDGKTRRIEPGSQCLVNGPAFRLADGRSRKDASRTAILRGLGNAIVPQLAAEFIRAYMEAR